MYRSLRCLAILLTCLSLMPLAWAQQPVGAAVEAQARGAEPHRNGPGQRREVRMADLHADQRRNLSEAVRRVQRRTGGQILGAEVIPFEGRNISRIKYMDERGRVRYMDDPGPGERLRPVPSRRDNNESP